MCQTSIGCICQITLVGLWLCLCYELKIAISKVFVATNYVALTCDKVTTIDNGSWILYPCICGPNLESHSLYDLTSEG
jgi:hypothetical protein